jgi:hypothetical protein
MVNEGDFERRQLSVNVRIRENIRKSVEGTHPARPEYLAIERSTKHEGMLGVDQSQQEG